ncbi:MAG: ABC transporter permease [Gemmatimonadetes bacterium]|nr:ABC transporter permease [Gemmatimonadota bacterium]
MARNLTIRYQRTFLGFVWALLNPLVTIAILVSVFGFVLRVGVADYWMFLVSGYFAWIFVVHTVSACAVTIRDHAHLVRNSAFPTEILVFSTAGVRLLELGIELLVVALVVGVLRHGGPPSSLLLLPVLVALLLGLTVAVALPVAAAAVFFTDVEFALPVGMTLLGYLSPVFYPVSLVPASWVSWYRVNPVADLLTMFHLTIYDGAWPPVALVARSALVIGVLLAIGLALFRWKRDLFAEVA